MMTRDEFMKRLEQLLAALPREERRDALDYYDEYFDAAGPEKEAETIAELGSPEEVARKILEDQPQLPDFADPNRQNTPLPEQPPRRERPRKNYTLRWIGLAVVVLILCAYLFQHSSAHLVHHTEEAAETASSHHAETDHTGSGHHTGTIATETGTPVNTSDPMELTGDYNSLTVSPDTLKKLNLDMDAGSVTFAQESGITEATLTFAHKADSAQLKVQFNASGSTISYKVPSNHLNSKNDKFTVTITLPAGFEMGRLDADFDMGSLTLGTLTVDKLTADLDMGSVTADTLTCSDADIDLDMGSFTADSVTGGKLTVSSDMGSVTIDRLDCLDSELTTDMGSVTAALTGTERDYSIDAEVEMGKLTVGGTAHKGSYCTTSGSRSLKLSSSMGSVTVSFLG